MGGAAMDKLKFKGTPGPWFVDEHGDIVDSNSESIADVWIAVDGNEEANARLIAAAPDMLEALLLFVEINNKDYSNESLGLERDFIELETKVNKAIKKALEEQ